jgi:hypothetical protein
VCVVRRVSGWMDRGGGAYMVGCIVKGDVRLGGSQSALSGAPCRIVRPLCCGLGLWVVGWRWVGVRAPASRVRRRRVEVEVG